MASNSGENKSKGISFYFSRPWELVKTLFLVLTWIVLGIQLEIVGPTLDILADHTGVLFAGISNILISRSAGYLTGNILGGLMQNTVKKYPELLLSLAFLIAAIVIFATPLIGNLIILCIAFFFQGISQGITDLGGTSLMLTMWKDDAGAPLNIVHLGFGIGAIFANFLVKPFLGEKAEKSSSTDSTTISELSRSKSSSSNIRIPYNTTSLICLVIFLGHLVIFILEKKREKKASTEREEINYQTVSKTDEGQKEIGPPSKSYSPYSPRSFGDGSFAYGLLMSICWFFYMFFLSGNDQTFGKFFFSYLKSEEFSISNSGATWGMILYWLSYSIGRLICAVLTVFLPVHFVLHGLWCCGLILAITWYFVVWFIGLNSTNLFVLGAFTGLVFSPTFPLSFGFINQRLKVNPTLLGAFLCGGSLGAMAFQKLGGIILDENRKHFPSLLIVCVICSIILYVLASIIYSIHQKKTKLAQNIRKNENLSLPSDEEQQMETYLTNE